MNHVRFAWSCERVVSGAVVCKIEAMCPFDHFHRVFFPIEEAKRFCFAPCPSRANNVSRTWSHQRTYAVDVSNMTYIPPVRFHRTFSRRVFFKTSRDFFSQRVVRISSTFSQPLIHEQISRPGKKTEDVFILMMKKLGNDHFGHRMS